MRLHHAIRVAAALALTIAGALPAASALGQSGSLWFRSGMLILEAADFVADQGLEPPGDSAAWEAISLPDEWRHRMQPGFRGNGWYRIKLDFPEAPSRMLALNIPFRRAYRLDFFVNGKLLGSSSDISARGGSRASESRVATLPTGAPLFLSVPPSLLNAGPNVIHVRLRGNSADYAMHGLGRVTFGDARPVRVANIMDGEKGYWAQRTFFAMALATGLITLFLWLARRSDRVMLWFTVTILAWGIAGIPRVYLRYADMPLFNGVVAAFINYGLVVPAVILCLRTVGLRWRWFEAALWAYLLVEVTHPVWSAGGNFFLHLGWDVVNTVLLLAGVVIILLAAKRPLRWTIKLEVLALLLMAVLMFWEVARYFGWVDVDNTSFRHYHVPVMIFAIGAAIFERHVVAVWRMERSNLDLERRVAEKAREIEANHARVEEAAREQALARERSRILADMHDGLGASLIALLRHVQSARLDAQVEQRVKEALQELRISIDALEPSEGDLSSVLGNLRYRLAPLIEPAGIQLEWEVGELPPIEDLEPSAVFALQRIVLEAVANALKHSGATHVRLSAQPAAHGGAEITVEDDGRGFDPSFAFTGLGIRNMRARAARLGSQLEILLRPGGGTIVRLVIPRALPVLVEDKASGKPDPRALHDLVPGTRAA